MITFRRRRLHCWDVCEDYNHCGDNLPLSFDNEKQLFEWIHRTLPWTEGDEKYPLRIEDNKVIQWTVLGFIE